jgi:MFS family permease
MRPLQQVRALCPRPITPANISPAYEAGPGAYSIWILCLFSFFTGCGSCSAFTASIKVAALNYPDARGTATAFPLAAFGLSALFFAAVSLALPHDTYSFLILLATGTVALPIVSLPFLNTHADTHEYSVIPGADNTRRGRRKSPADESSALNSPVNALSRTTSPPPYNVDSPDSPFLHTDPSQEREHDHATSLDLDRSQILDDTSPPPTQQLDIRGWQLVHLRRFWLIFALLGLLTGIGLMTINNIGNVTLALFLSEPSPPSHAFITRTQSMHVSILSFFSFCGRLTSGIGSDFLLRVLGPRKGTRFWMLVCSSALFIAAQYISIKLTNPHLLILISSITGLGYGMLFGVYPSIVAHNFGVAGLSQNWGTMTLAPVVSGNVFNILYGRIYDNHSVVDEDSGDRECRLGRECYESAYMVTFVAAVAALGLSGYAVWRDWKGAGGVDEDEEVEGQGHEEGTRAHSA